MIIEVRCPVDPFFSSGPTVTCSTTGIANIPIEGKVSQNWQKKVLVCMLCQKKGNLLCIRFTRKNPGHVSKL